jgi:hypothetical protein
MYDFDLKAASPILSILEFTEPNKKWLDYVHQSRWGIYNGPLYDLVIGPVANDDIFATLIVYENGILSEDQTLSALKVKQFFNQYVFKTEKALQYFSYKESFDPGKKNE